MRIVSTIGSSAFSHLARISARGVSRAAIIGVKEEIELHQITWLRRGQHQSPSLQTLQTCLLFLTFELEQTASVPDVISSYLVENGDMIFCHMFDGHSQHRQ